MSRHGVRTLVLVVVAVLGVGVLVDTVVRARVEASVASQIGAELGAARADVSIAGFPFLAQVIAGSLDRVEVSAPSAVMDGVRIDDVDAVLRGVSTGTPRTVAALQLRGSVDPASLAAVLPGGVRAAVDGDRLVLALDVAGVALEATAVPRAAGRAVALDVEGLTAAGVTLDPRALPLGLGDALTSLSVPLDALPVGVELTSVTVSGGRVKVVAAGTDLVLTSVPGSATGLSPSEPPSGATGVGTAG